MISATGLPAVSLLLALLLLAGCGVSEPTVSAPSPGKGPSPQSSSVIEIPADSPKLAQVRVAEVRVAELPTDEFTAPGKIEANPNRVSKVLLPVAGRITEVLVHFGDAVKKDQPLLLIESPEADAAASAFLQAEGEVSQASSGLHKAQTDFERVQDLFKGDAIAKKELVAAETTVAQAKTALRQAQTAVQQANARLELLGLKPAGFRQKIAVRAPLSGKITELTVVAGEYRNDLSAPLMTIADLSTVWVSADVPESSIRLVAVGERFEVTLSAFPGEVFHSRVTRLADSVSPQTRTIEVWAELSNPQGRLRPQMFGEVRHIESYHKVAAVPVSAVIQAQRKTIVFREIATGKFQQTEVEVGKRSGDLLPVLKGLSPGHRVVVDGAMLLRGY
jgi:cobalt-zinc-cadmium efflux system membrane fusion protein